MNQFVEKTNVNFKTVIIVSLKKKKKNSRHYFHTAHVVEENLIYHYTTIPHIINTSYSLSTEILYCDQSYSH